MIARRDERRLLTSALAALLPWVSQGATVHGQGPPEPQPSKQEPSEEQKQAGAKLIRKAASDADEDLMDAILRLMSEAARRLDVELDAGKETQAVQREIAQRLDDAIREAASRRRPSRTGGQTASSDKRRMPREGKGAAKGSNKGLADSDQPAESTAPATGVAEDQRDPAGKLRDTRRSWGHLPMRERDEILQGVGEQFLEQYRAWIERYFRALQEPEE